MENKVMETTVLLKDKLRSKGYCIAQNVFTLTEIRAFQEAITTSINRYAKAMLLPYVTSMPEANFGERLELAAQENPAYTNAIISGLYADGHLVAPINDIYEHARFRNIINKLIHPHPNQKPTTRLRMSLASQPDKGHPWHSDVVFPAKLGCGSNKLTCWIPLQDVSKENGALELVSKFFNEPFEHKIVNGQFAIDEKELDEYSKTAIHCKAGDVLFIDRFTPHRSLKNTSSTVRWSIVLWVKGFEEGSEN